MGNASFSSPVGSRQANDALPDITAPLSWPAGAFSYRIQQQPSFAPINGYAGRWVPLTTPDVDPERHPGYKQGSSIQLRYWGHSAGGPSTCIVPSLRPMIVESGRLHLNPPPETRNDLTQYPGTLTNAPVDEAESSEGTVQVIEPETTEVEAPVEAGDAVEATGEAVNEAGEAVEGAAQETQEAAEGQVQTLEVETVQEGEDKRCSARGGDRAPTGSE